MYVIVDSTSEGVTKGSNLLLEDVDNPFKIGEFTISSFGFLVIESFFGSKVSLSISNILFRLSPKGKSISLSDQGNIKVNIALLKIKSSFGTIEVESLNFSGGFNLILGGIKSSGDFVLFKGLGTFFKTSLESVKHGVDFIVESTFEVAGVDGGGEGIGVEGFSVVVDLASSFDSRGGFIDVFEVCEVGGSVGDVDTL